LVPPGGACALPPAAAPLCCSPPRHARPCCHFMRCVAWWKAPVRPWLLRQPHASPFPMPVTHCPCFPPPLTDPAWPSRHVWRAGARRPGSLAPFPATAPLCAVPAAALPCTVWCVGCGFRAVAGAPLGSGWWAGRWFLTGAMVSHATLALAPPPPITSDRAAYQYSPTGLNRRAPRGRLYPSDSSEMASSPTTSEHPAGGTPTSSEKGSAGRTATVCVCVCAHGRAPCLWLYPRVPPPSLNDFGLAALLNACAGARGRGAAS
jgi:hypothetical protein